MIELLDRRYLIYNRTLDDLRTAESKGLALVIAPEAPLSIGRFEHDPRRLAAAAQLGYHDAARLEQKIRSFFRRPADIPQ